MFNLRSKGLTKVAIAGILGGVVGAIGTAISGWSERKSMEAYIDSRIDEKLSLVEEDEDDNEDD